MEAKELYLAAGRSLNRAEESQFFGKPCFKTSGKAFIAFFEDCMVFKLNGEDHSLALSLQGSVLFDPSGKGRPMREWVQVPAAHAELWKHFALSALNYAEKNVSQ